MDKPVPRRRYPQLFERPTQAVFCRNNTTTNYPELDELMRSTQTPENIRTSYRDGLTIHGLTKLLTGVWWERIIWFFALSICIGIIAYFTTGFFNEYNKHDVRTEIRIQTARNLSYPAATICSDHPVATLCQNNKTYLHGEPCTTTNTLIDQLSIYSNREHVTPHPLFKKCIIFNHYGNLTTNKKLYWIRFKPSVAELYIYFHAHNDLFNIADNIFHIYGKKKGVITFNDIKYISRLPSPHPSNCIEGQHADNALATPYSESKCLHTCALKKLISQCGAIPHEYLDYAPHLRTLMPPHKNISHIEVRRCMFYLMLASFQNPTICDCRVSCRETLFKWRQTISQHNHVESIELNFMLESKIFSNITEIPSYPPEKFVTDIGGWMGLFSGTSVLSFVEIMLLIILSITAACRKLRRHVTTRRLQISSSPA